MESFSSQITAANQMLLVKGKHEAIGEYFTPDYVVHLTGRDVTGGHKLVREFLGLYLRAFPRLEVALEVLVENEDRVAWQRTLHGEQHGPLKGFPPSGRMIVWRDVITSRFRDGLIAEEWVISDLAEQLLLSRKKS